MPENLDRDNSVEMGIVRTIELYLTACADRAKNLVTGQSAARE
jgi:hypothetical protein